ncbi:MAG: glycosyltransferase family 2 protein [Planctomycetota bacterium]|nr:glycosyltransferase family 2 protein [Planctomycetota bacterium]
MDEKVTTDRPALSLIIPAFNEQASIGKVIADARDVLTRHGYPHEIIVVVDGSTDATAEVAAAAGAKIVRHSLNFGYGRSLKSGILAADNNLVAISDADSTYPIERLPDLIAAASAVDMAIGARTGSFYHGSIWKRAGRIVFRLLSEFTAGQKIPDINSGMRVFRRSQIIPFFPIISAGFSFTTTSTLAYLLNDLSIKYIPIEYKARTGRSKVRHFRDSLRALQIILEAILRCNPIKAFILLAAPLGFLSILFLMAALVSWSTVCLTLSALFICCSVLTMALGFLAVAISPFRRSAETNSFAITVQAASTANPPA